MQLNDEPYDRGTVRGQAILAEVDQHAAWRNSFLWELTLASESPELSCANEVLAECAGYVAALNGRGFQEKFLENLRPSARVSLAGWSDVFPQLSLRDASPLASGSYMSCQSFSGLYVSACRCRLPQGTEEASTAPERDENP